MRNFVRRQNIKLLEETLHKETDPRKRGSFSASCANSRLCRPRKIARMRRLRMARSRASKQRPSIR
jgi:hypothetical protein